MDKSDTDALRNAVQLLEHPSLAARLANMIGKPVELLGRALPAGASQAIAVATTKSLEAAVKVALLTIRGGSQASSQMLHRALAVASGAAGGAFGILSLPLELPVSTIIILRSILDIARSEGENLADPESSLSCVEVFGLGGRTETDDAAEGGYFVVRGVFATSVTEAARFIAERGIVEEGSPVLVRLIAQIASRFGFRRFTKGRRADYSCHRCARRSCHQLCFYRPLPVCRARPFYRATTRAKVWQRYCFRCVRAPSSGSPAHRRSKRVKCPLLAQSRHQFVVNVCFGGKAGIIRT